MAKKCSHCGCSIEDNEKVFCPNCGEFIDKELNLIKKLDKTLDNYEKNETKTVKEKPKQTEVKQVTHHKYDDDDSEITKLKKTSSGGINSIFIIIIVIIIIAVILKIALF
ncbi:zinc ribbon domain-containing protein [Clostridium sp. MD294]|uniref:zinc ribbon domain-containing protein n=1 Tax=Clostridium sp. MD294 TaxID=97138 RepID=UPI0002CACFBA|nr:zinc ribbon domain-containing protein [Clostridium sp. MD294]NDO47646.1 zinc ribbon domain-containing protein [Clostridium sp. MD294]USF30037.1 hypothetical protein C820_001460 [Clostridium sp. MD294]